jgi:hypothetical protein
MKLQNKQDNLKKIQTEIKLENFIIKKEFEILNESENNLKNLIGNTLNHFGPALFDLFKNETNSNLNYLQKVFNDFKSVFKLKYTTKDTNKDINDTKY